MTARLSDLLSLGWLLVCGCSLGTLGDYDLEPCSSDADCMPRNLGLEGCQVYSCRRERCELGPRDADHDHVPDADSCEQELDQRLDCDDGDAQRSPRLPEICDGLDNDCDEKIDEAETEPEGPVLSVDNAVTVALPGKGSMMELASGDDGTDTRVVAISDEHESYMLAIRDVEAEGLSWRPIRFELNKSNRGDETCRPNAEGWLDCTFRDLALARGNSPLFSGAVQRLGCAAGRIRFGIARAADAELALGGLQSTCNPTTERSGLSLASLSGGRMSGVAVWRETRDARTNLVALRLGLDADGSSIEVRDQPLTLGVAASARDAPSVIGWRTVRAEGYAVGAATDAGAVAWLVPTDVSGPTQRLNLSSGSIDRVTLASSGAEHGQTPRLATAWLEHEGARARISFSTLELSPDGVASRSTRTTAIERANAVRAGPILAYAASGVIQSRVSSDSGGWTLLWMEVAEDIQKLMAVRFAERDGQPVGAPVELARGALATPFALDGNLTQAALYGWLETNAGSRQLRLANRLCNSRD